MCIFLIELSTACAHSAVCHNYHNWLCKSYRLRPPSREQPVRLADRELPACACIAHTHTQPPLNTHRKRTLLRFACAASTHHAWSVACNPSPGRVWQQLQLSLCFAFQFTVYVCRFVAVEARNVGIIIRQLLNKTTEQHKRPHTSTRVPGVEHKFDNRHFAA